MVGPVTESAATTERMRRKLRSELGADVCAALEDPAVTDVMLNPDGSLWRSRAGRDERFGAMAALAARNALNTMASALGETINAERPLLEGELDLLNGERLMATIPPVSRAPTFAIRKHVSSRMTLDDWRDQGGLSDGDAAQLRGAVRDRRNIVVSGGTGSGKTTFANALLAEIADASPEHRVLVVEDTRELHLDAPNRVDHRTTTAVDINRLLRVAMREKPDRIVVGEVRGGEAYEMLKLWNTGHPGGVATIHAASAASAWVRLEQMCGEAVESTARIRAAVRAAVGCIVQLRRFEDGSRRVVDIEMADAEFGAPEGGEEDGGGIDALRAEVAELRGLVLDEEAAPAAANGHGTTG